jgi:hypothetical protein
MVEVGAASKPWNSRRSFLGSVGTVAAGCIVDAKRALSYEQRPLRPVTYDQYGLITQQDLDGGDTAQREGWYWFGTWLRENPPINERWPMNRERSYDEVLTLLEIGKTGEFRRHPDPRWAQSSDFTRDQTVPLVAAMAVHDDRDRLQRFYHELRRRNWFAQKKGDTLADPVHRNLIRRARNEKPNAITDSASLGAAVQARILVARAKGLDDVGDDLNLIVILLMATIRESSTSVAAIRNYYAKNRPDNYGMFLGSYRRRYGVDLDVSKEVMRDRMIKGIGGDWKPDCPRVLGALRWYCRYESNGNPGLADLYEPMVRKWLE